MTNEGRSSKLRRLLGRVGSHPRRELAFVAGAWLAAPFVEASLASLGLQRTLRWVEALPIGHAAETMTPLAGERLVRAAYRRHLLHGSCLPQSIVQYLVHRRRGDSVRLVIGVRRPASAVTPPLEAHAWVEAIEPSGNGARVASATREGFVPLASGGES